MIELVGSLLSPYTIVVGASLALAQTIKYITLAVRNQKLSGVRQIYASGNMPSAHSTSVVALLVIIGLKDGVESGLFGLGSLFAIIVMYDAIMVRRSVGEQGKAIRALIEKTGNGTPMPHSAKGHTPSELLVGALLGAIIGVVVFFATK